MLLKDSNIRTVALVTGAATGIEKAIGLVYAKEGCLERAFLRMQVQLKIKEARKSVSIVNMAPVAGLTGFAGLPAYRTTKGGVIKCTWVKQYDILGTILMSHYSAGMNGLGF